MAKMFSKCDSNHDSKIDYSEARMSIVVDKNNSYYNSDAIDPNYVPLPSVNYACRISQDDFTGYDLDSDNFISFNEFIKPLKRRKVQDVDEEARLVLRAKIRFFQKIDKDSNGKLDFDEWIEVY